jgi:pimeloyl-ACP methyl ester carboxylesterase
MDPASRTLVANGLRHHVLEWDGGGQTTLLCLHGFLDFAWAFHRVGPLLASAGYHVVAPDLRGHGRTERVGAGGYYHFMDYVLDVADLADAVARERLALVGHSMGGGIALYFSGVFPDRVWRAVVMEGGRLPETPLEAAPHRVVEWIQGVRRARTHGPRVYPSLEAAAARIREHDRFCSEEEARFLAARGTDQVAGGFVFQHDPLHVTRAPYPFRADVASSFWRAIQCPVLLLEGEQTELRRTPDWEDRIQAFRDLRQAVIPRAGHMMMRHRPEEVAKAVLDFLRT